MISINVGAVFGRAVPVRRGKVLRSGMTQDAIRLVIEVYPDMASVVRRLYLADQSFRDLCEDFASVQVTLTGLARHPDQASRPGIVEYRRLVNDLTQDIGKYLLRVADRPVKGTHE